MTVLTRTRIFIIIFDVLDGLLKRSRTSMSPSSSSLFQFGWSGEESHLTMDREVQIENLGNGVSVYSLQVNLTFRGERCTKGGTEELKVP